MGHALSPARREAVKKLFLRALIKRDGSVSAACKDAKISRTAVYNWRKEDDAFRGEWEEIEELELDDQEFSLATRSKKGWLEPVFHEGKICGHKRRFDNRLGMWFLEKRRPEKFGSGRVSLDRVDPTEFAERLVEAQRLMDEASLEDEEE